MEENSKETNASNRGDILSMEDGFNTRVNLFIIRYLYYHMKKHSCFMEEGKGKRQKSKDLKKRVGITRQRFSRIFNGYNFELSGKEAENIAGLFNISTDYFRKNGKLVEVHGIDRNDWKCYFNRQYNGSVKDVPYTPKERMGRADEVDARLQELVKKNFVANHYDTRMALYRIFYFFENGVAFREVSTLNKFLENLQLLKISDWKELKNNPADMKRYFHLLEKHYEYVNAYLKCRELEKTD